MLELNRSSGILLHISSLPGKFGIGDLGREAYMWIDFLDQTGTKYWQILPLNPTGYGNSPYQGLSAFAGNPLFIDLEKLYKSGLLDASDLENRPRFPQQKVDFQKILSWKPELFKKAFSNFLSKKSRKLVRQYNAFKIENKTWLNDFSLFMALREKFDLVSWNKWPDRLRLHKPDALGEFEKENKSEVEYHSFLQFIFAQQMKELKIYANSKGIYLIGDIPIFMGYDCADVWAYSHLFDLNKDLKPVAVAGVPPDFFSKTGQLWGNPLYNWKAHKKEGYAWWNRRVNETLKTVDLIRLDHFRGFAGFYRIPAGSKTAETGRWVRGPGKDLFDTMQAHIGTLPFIAEDLGVITPDVIALRERYNFPGMRLFQFAFWENADDEFLPHNYPVNCVAYTGTHDNDTTVSWFKHASGKEKRFCKSYLGGHTHDIAHEMIITIWRSNAILAIAPMQDFLRLGGLARMNLPATTEGNWLWRMRHGKATDRLAKWIKDINITFNRTSDVKDWPAEEYFVR
ncbi:MAG: 4-alpha-glucanotransferase [Anaerolineaceae bacterium]|nr:4-alpha-glucanotransferase [Anaerolineaceae bacterium]